jgi:hypothetical protein
VCEAACNWIVEAGASATITCTDRTACDVTCRGGAQCELFCEGDADCDVTCQEGARCTLHCEGSGRCRLMGCPAADEVHCESGTLKLCRAGACP